MSFELRKQERKFFELKDDIMRRADEMGITLRVLGAVGVRIHCPKFKYIEYSAGRKLSDLDFAAYNSSAEGIEKIFADLGWAEDRFVRALYGTKRRIFHSKNGMHSDIFFDKLEFCHDVNLRGRLEIDYPTISLVDLLLEKLQIVKLNGKDVVDMMTLLREHEVGEADDETINIEYLASLCAKDWGLWKTATANLNKLVDFLPMLKKGDARDVGAKIKRALEAIEGRPKTLKWKLRAKMGERQKWYREVEELYRQ